MYLKPDRLLQVVVSVFLYFLPRENQELCSGLSVGNRRLERSHVFVVRLSFFPSLHLLFFLNAVFFFFCQSKT